MKILIAAIGKGRAGPEMELMREYLRRLPWKVALQELDIKQNLPAASRKREETKLLLAACAASEKRIALDEHGNALSSREFADLLNEWRQQGIRDIAFIIGGADGLDATQLSSAEVKLAFGRLSWPHLLVRALLAEQLYRAYTLITGHPYHRD